MVVGELPLVVRNLELAVSSFVKVADKRAEVTGRLDVRDSVAGILELPFRLSRLAAIPGCHGVDPFALR